jgi:rhodanese-related sulfurtransferase
MRSIGSLVVKALFLVGIATVIGLGMNFLPGRGLPWLYVPPKESVISGVKVALIDEKDAFRLFNQSTTVFVDARGAESFDESHVKGAVHLAPEDKEERFPAVQPLLPEESTVVLYCHSPECEMAEEVARFLAQLGYKNLIIMSAGFPAWEKAGYPVQQGRGKKSSS